VVQGRKENLCSVFHIIKSPILRDSYKVSNALRKDYLQWNARNIHRNAYENAGDCTGFTCGTRLGI